jgi:hypothetical protein
MDKQVWDMQPLIALDRKSFYDETLFEIQKRLMGSQATKMLLVKID